MPTPRNASWLGISRCRCQLWGLTGRNHGKRSLTSNLVARLYSTFSHGVESFDVRCGSSGLITVDIYNSHHLTSPSRPLIIYLPPTGTHLQHTHPSIPSILQTHPLAAIKYRWNHVPSPSLSNDLRPKSSPFTTIPTSHPFPIPLHDTFYAYTWLVNQYLPSLASFNSPSSPNLVQDGCRTSPSSSLSPYASSKISPRSIILYGSHLGGTLATSLALTECKASKNVPYNIAGLIVRDGVYDWTGVATSLPSTPSNTSASPSSPSPQLANDLTLEISHPWTLQTLHALKTTLFTTPASAFDSFASPTLFFRTPSVTVPKSPYFPGCEPPPSPSPALDVDLGALSLSEAEYAALTSAEYDSLPGDDKREGKDVKGKGGKEGRRLEEPETARSSHVKFPPRDSGLKIPRSLFLVTRPEKAWEEEGDELRKQVEGMVKLMRRSVVLHELKDRVLWDEDADPEAASEERVQLAKLDGLGWQKEEEERVMEEWFEGVDF